jgi:hypothetical protein
MNKINKNIISKKYHNITKFYENLIF